MFAHSNFIASTDLSHLTRENKGPAIRRYIFGKLFFVLRSLKNTSTNQLMSILYIVAVFNSNYMRYDCRVLLLPLCCYAIAMHVVHTVLCAATARCTALPTQYTLEFARLQARLYASYCKYCLLPIL